MHIEFLVEDASGQKALDRLIPKIIDVDENSFRVVPYKGIGRIPKGMGSNQNASKRILLDQLPRLLQGYGKTFSGGGPHYKAAVVVVCDLDDKDLEVFLAELKAVLDGCNPAPHAVFCVAIEEGEAWLLGDQQAIGTAYPAAKSDPLKAYVQDSICGTWEILAEVVHPGGVAAIRSVGWPEAGKRKCEWAEQITPHMNVEINQSPSFQHFRDKLRSMVRAEGHHNS